MTDIQKAIDAIRPDVERDISAQWVKADCYAVVAGCLFLFVFLFFLFISRPAPPLFSIFYLILAILLYFAFRRPLIGMLFPLLENGREILDTEPVSADDFRERAELFARYGQPDAATADYHRALDLAPENETIRYEYALFLWRFERPDEALKWLERVTPISSESQASAYFLRGRILEKTDPDRALKSYDRALEIEPDNIEFLSCRTRFFLDGDRLDEAASGIDEMAELFKRNGRSPSATWEKLKGILELKRGDAASAVRSLNKAIRKNGQADDVECYSFRSEAYDRLGRPDRARIDRERIKTAIAPPDREDYSEA